MESINTKTKIEIVPISEDQVTVNGKWIYQDCNGLWISRDELTPNEYREFRRWVALKKIEGREGLTKGGSPSVEIDTSADASRSPDL